MQQKALEEVQFIAIVAEHSTLITFLVYHILHYLQEVQFTLGSTALTIHSNYQKKKLYIYIGENNEGQV